MTRGMTAILALIGILFAARACVYVSPKHLIVPGVGVGDFRLGMSKDEVLKRLGKPESIYFGGYMYTLDNLPRQYRLSYEHIDFEVIGKSIERIHARNPSYKFTNGLGVEDSEEKTKQAFGEDFELSKTTVGHYLTYEDEGVAFVVEKNDKTVIEIRVFLPRPRAFMNVEGVDFRDRDLRHAGDILDTLTFNQKTLWPPAERLPGGFDPETLLEAGKNPGLGVRALHAQGIIGAGVHVGLIDRPIQLGHYEYDDKIVSYHAAAFEPDQSSEHGPAMASLLVGTRCGTAPGAKLHVVAVRSRERDAGHFARALDQFVVYNKSAPEGEKIRVVSASDQPSGEGSEYDNQSLWDEAVERAQAQRILVLDCTWRHGFVSLCWLDPGNREDVAACTPGFRGGAVEVDPGHIHVPAYPRTWAQTEPWGYVYDGGCTGLRPPKATNGYSPTMPYAAGVLAMGWQIGPDLTPTRMKELLFESAHVHESGATMINPTAFIDLVRRQSKRDRF